jgi:hypothetical protein
MLERSYADGGENAAEREREREREATSQQTRGLQQLIDD